MATYLITVLAYQGVQVIRKKLKEKGHDLSWRSLKDIFELQGRVTMTFNGCCKPKTPAIPYPVRP